MKHNISDNSSSDLLNCGKQLSKADCKHDIGIISPYKGYMVSLFYINIHLLTHPADKEQH